METWQFTNQNSDPKHVEATIAYGSVKTKIKINSENYTPAPKPDFEIITKIPPPNSVDGSTESSVMYQLKANGVLIPDAQVRVSMSTGSTTGIGSQIYLNNMGGGYYKGNLSWPDTTDTFTVEVKAIKDGINTSIITHNVAVAKKIVADYFYASRDTPDYSVKVNERGSQRFCVNAYTSIGELDKVVWIYQFDESGTGYTLLDDNDPFDSHETTSGRECETVTFDQVGENQIVKAQVHRTGSSDSFRDVIWRPDVESSAIPIVNIQSPTMPTDGTNILLAVGEEPYFYVTIQDSDDDTRNLEWRLDGVLIDTDRVGGGAPDENATESLRHAFVDAGIHELEAIAIDNKNNQDSVKWTVQVGQDDPDNDAPTGAIKNPDGLENVDIFRVGYAYDFEWECYDQDGNLAVIERFVDGTQDFGRVPRSEDDHVYVDDRVGGYSDKFGHGPREIYFHEEIEYELGVLCKDENGAESTTTRIINVQAADEGSGHVPKIVRLFPQANQTFYIDVGDEVNLELTVTDED
ncbi:MAG: hypothetical protein U9N34_04985, partial [Candidatus Cloacimonadota bacterium]|nr:hypothetical protein [Candidatus Cloacimonadota bacterium]